MSKSSLNDGEVRQTKPSQLKAEIAHLFKRKRPVFLWGPPGVGKSDIIASIGKDMGAHVIDLRLALLEPTDLRGIPYFDENTQKMKWGETSDLPDQELAAQFSHVILFLDEMNQAPPSVQAAAYQLILNRRIGQYKLPDNVVIVAAGNRESDRGVSYRMPSPLANRFVHLEIVVDFDDWLEWALSGRINAEVVGYLTGNKMDLFAFNPATASRAFPTPRSWAFVSEILPTKDEVMSDELLHDMIAGTIGDGTAIKFMAHRKLTHAMPNPTDILTGKVTHLAKNKDRSNISALFSLTAALCYELKEFHEKFPKDEDGLNHRGQHFFTFMMENFDTEMMMIGVRTALKTYKLPFSPRNVPAVQQFYKKHGNLLIESLG